MSKPIIADSIFQARIAGVRAVMKQQGVSAIILPCGGELAWLIDHTVISHDSSFALLIRVEEELPTLVINGLELPAVKPRPAVFKIAEFGGESTTTLEETIIELLSENFFFGVIAPGNQFWAEYLIPLQHGLPGATWRLGTPIVSILRRTKDSAEIQALSEVAAAVDATVSDIQNGVIPLRGRTEKDVADDVSRLLIKHGHDKVDFVIVAAGPNAADPHHEPDDTIIGDGFVLFDIGGTRNGYCSDTTRMVYVGKPSARETEAYETLRLAQQAGVAAVRPGITGKELDAIVRGQLEAAGYPGYPHGLGHGIGRQTHEAPRVSMMRPDILQVGDVISIEPGIYIAEEFGMRIEDIVIVTEAGTFPLNLTDHGLIIVEP